jgi:beta-glucosidase
VVRGDDPHGPRVVFERLLTTPVVTGEEMPAEPHSALLTATLVVPESGEYDVEVTTNGTTELLLDGRVVSLAPGRLPESLPESNAGSVVLEAGTAYELLVRLRVPEGTADGSPGPLHGVLRMQRRLGEDDFRAAVAAAASADVAVVVVATNLDTESEGFDRSSLALPGRQEALIRAVRAANPRTVVVVNAGAPVAMDWAEEVPAVLQSWFGGQEAGNGLADVLVGKVDASGRLPVTIPGSLEHTPAFAHYPGSDGKVVYAEGSLVGYPWYDTHATPPRFCFGHGLSYTRFSFGPARFDPATLELSLEVTNTGSRSGCSVVQAYVRDPHLRLVGFAKVDLEPTESGLATIDLRNGLSRWDSSVKAWTTTAGPRRLLVGRSATDIITSLDVEVMTS